MGWSLFNRVNFDGCQCWFCCLNSFNVIVIGRVSKDASQPTQQMSLLFIHFSTRSFFTSRWNNRKSRLLTRQKRQQTTRASHLREHELSIFWAIFRAVNDTAICKKVHRSVELKALQWHKLVILEENFQRSDCHVIGEMRLVIRFHQLDFILERFALWQALAERKRWIFVPIVGSVERHVAVEKFILRAF